MTNARQELEKMLAGRTVAYGWVAQQNWRVSGPRVEFRSDAEFRAALPTLDFEYNEGYGSQELYGYVVFTDGTWLSRGEYDGSEWWQDNRCPDEASVFAWMTESRG